MFILKCYIVKIRWGCRLDLLVPGNFLKLLNHKSLSYILEQTGIWHFLDFNYTQEMSQTHVPKHPLAIRDAAGTDFCQARPIVNSKASTMVTRWVYIFKTWEVRTDPFLAGLTCYHIPWYELVLGPIIVLKNPGFEHILKVAKSQKYFCFDSNLQKKRCQIMPLSASP